MFVVPNSKVCVCEKTKEGDFRKLDTVCGKWFKNKMSDISSKKRVYHRM
jgi:hypothetical protein